MCCDLPEITQLVGAELGLQPGLFGIEPHHLSPFPSVQEPFLFKNSLPSIFWGSLFQAQIQENSILLLCMCSVG